MKKTIQLLTMVFMMISLIACQKDKILFGPSNLTFNEETLLLTWDKDEQAVSYVLNIDGEQIDVEDNSYSLASYEPKTYMIRVKSVYENKESIYSNALKVFLQKAEFVSIYVKEGSIYVTGLEGASYNYTLLVDIQKTEKKNGGPTFLIPNIYKERKIETTVSIKVGTDYLHEYMTIIDLTSMRVDNDQDLLIDCINPKTVYINGERIEEGITFTKENVILSKDLIKTYDKETIISVSGDTYYTKKYYIGESSVKLLSKSRVPIDEPLVFIFSSTSWNLILGSNGNVLIKDVDYTFIDGTLTLLDAFVNRYISENPESSKITLSASFSNTSETLIIGLVIQIK